MRRFWSKVQMSSVDECWSWTGRLDPKGYGRFDLNGKPTLSHRVAYALAYEDDIAGRVVCHSCDNPRCCNPSHLWLGSQADNVADMDRKGRGRRVTRRGESSNKAKITASQALDIFNSPESGPTLATRFGITKEAVHHIKAGKNWAHVTGGRRAS